MVKTCAIIPSQEERAVILSLLCLAVEQAGLATSTTGHSLGAVFKSGLLESCSPYVGICCARAALRQCEHVSVHIAVSAL